MPGAAFASVFAAAFASVFSVSFAALVGSFAVATTLLVGCARDAAPRSHEPFNIAPAATASARPIDPAPKADAAEAFARVEERFRASMHRYAKIVRDQDGFEASDKTMYYFDSDLNLVWIERSWGVEGVEGRQKFELEQEEVRCFQMKESNPSEERTTSFCEGARSVGLDDEQIDAARAAATDEIGLLVSALVHQRETVSVEEGCSDETAGDAVQVGDQEYVTMLRLSVPNVLCERVEELLRKLGIESD